MKLELLIFIFATCSGYKLRSNQRAPDHAASSAGEDYLSVTISNQYIPPESKKSSRQYLPPVDAKRIDNQTPNEISYSYIAPEYTSYYIPPSEMKQYFDYPDNTETKQYILPSDPISYQYAPKEDIKAVPDQYLPPFETKQNAYTEPNHNTNNYHQRTEQSAPSNVYFANTDLSQSEQFAKPEPQSTTNQYSTHSPINPQYYANLEQYLPPSSNEVVSILPQNKQQNNLPVPQATRRYDNQYQQLDTQTYTSNQTSSSSPYGYNAYVPQQIENNQNNINNIQEINANLNLIKQVETAFKPYTPPTEMQISNSNNNNNNQQKWVPEIYTTTQYPIHQNLYNNQVDNNRISYNDRIENNQYTQNIPYGERITSPPPLYASSRSSSQPTIPPPSEKPAEPITQQTKFIPQLPSQFKPSQPIEMPTHQPYHQNQHQPKPVYQQQTATIPQESMSKFPYQQSFNRNVQHSAPYVAGPTTEAMPILKQTSEMQLDGSYNYETLTGDQTHIMQHGHIENLGTDHEEQVMQGSYSFIGDDGKTYTVNYIADANGFRATGDHLPTPPPIPDVIQRSIEFNMAEEAAARATQKPTLGYQYPQVVDNRSYQVHEPARERSSQYPIDGGYKY